MQAGPVIQAGKPLSIKLPVAARAGIIGCSLLRDRFVAVATLLATVYLAYFFLKMPITTEARDYLFRADGLRAATFWVALFNPNGANTRAVSMLFFGITRRACGLGSQCVNAIQIVELLVGFAMGTIHLRQLIARPRIAAGAMLFWCASLPVFTAGFWQATQHDKLAFVFSLAALSLGLRAIRKDRSDKLVVTSLGLTLLFMLALNSKESAFILPPAAIAQVALFARGGMRGVRRASALYGAPIIYAVLYIAIYLWHLNGSWKTHVLSGDTMQNIGFYFGSLFWTRGLAGYALPPLLILIIATFYLCRQESKGRFLLFEGSLHHVDTDIPKVSLYLLTIFLASMVLVIKAQVPGDYYLLFGDWAFVSWIAATLIAAQIAGRLAKSAVMACSVLVMILFIFGRATDFFAPGGAWHLIQEARRLNTGYSLIGRYCSPRLTEGMKLVFSDRLAGQWFFFRGGDEAPDQLVGAFICKDGQTPSMTYSFDGSTRAEHPGQLVAVWSQKLKVAYISRNDVMLYQATQVSNPSVAARPGK